MLVKIDLKSLKLKSFNLRPIQPNITNSPYLMSPGRKWVFYQYQYFDTVNSILSNNFHFHKTNEIAGSELKMQLFAQSKRYGFTFDDNFFWQLSEKSEFKISELNNQANQII